MSKPDILGLYHFAYPCRDAEETRQFYEGILGLPLVQCMKADRVPSTGEKKSYVHFFFEMADDSYIAFFDLGDDVAPLPSPNTPDWVQHFAMEVASMEEVASYKKKLEENGVEVLGVVDHDFIQSIYFFDPNGLRLEITTRTDEPGFLESAARTAHATLAEWTKQKRERLAKGAA
jgi:catechol 2,3-dioxygenase-like lactoylglutathione lyase family enzyme